MRQLQMNLHRRHTAKHRGFTLVELMVVVLVVGLVLTLGVPAFNRMAASAQLDRARQSLNGMLSQAQLLADTDRVTTAVRIYPASWEFAPLREDSATSIPDRQVASLYRYVSRTNANPLNPLAPFFDERFEPVVDGPRQLFPANTWIAPLEALDSELDVNGYSSIAEAMLQGNIGEFELNAVEREDSFLDADDFLLVIEPGRGIVSPVLGGIRKSWAVKAYDPRDPDSGGLYADETGQTETAGPWRNGDYVEDARFRRHNSAGVVIYPRDGFVELGDDISPRDRGDYLRERGRGYFIDRKGGGLVAQSLGNEQD